MKIFKVVFIVSLLSLFLAECKPTGEAPTPGLSLSPQERLQPPSDSGTMPDLDDPEDKLEEEPDAAPEDASPPDEEPKEDGGEPEDTGDGGDSDDDDDFTIPPIEDKPPSGTADEWRPKNFLLSEPRHLQALTETPAEVVIKFKNQLGEKSYIKVFRNKEPFEVGEVVFEEGGLTMKVPLKGEGGTGVYDVLYVSYSSIGMERGYFVFYVELREYEGQKLDSILDFRENSIKGPQYVPLDDYLLKVSGLVDNPYTVSYSELMKGRFEKRAKTLHCVEGWGANVLWEGFSVVDLIVEAIPKKEATIVIFYAYDGYTTSVKLDYLIKYDVLAAYKMNDVPLPAMRGFPLQLVAEDKWGYKWIKWISQIELSDDENFRGFWEGYGYNNDGSLSGPIFEE